MKKLINYSNGLGSLFFFLILGLTTELYSQNSISLLNFHSVSPTGLPYNVVIDSNSFTGFELSIGDTIGIFDDTLCVGISVIEQSFLEGNGLNIIAWEGDSEYDLPGFIPGHIIRIAILSRYFYEPQIFEPNLNFVVGNGSFGAGSYSSVNLDMEIFDIPILDISPTILMFDATPVNSINNQLLELSNVGDRNLVINSIFSNNTAFYTETTSEMVIFPGDSISIQVNFGPASQGYYFGGISINYNNPDNSPKTIEISGVATQDLHPVMSGYSNSIYMGEFVMGDTAHFSWTVQNTGNDTLNVWDIYADDYHFIIEQNEFNLEPGSLVSIPIRFIPDGRGIFSTNVNFLHNAPNVNQNWINISAIGFDGHFETVVPTGLPYTIVVDSALVDYQGLNYGEEIGVFDDSICVGIGVKGLTETIQITAWEEDTYYNLPGFSIGDSITFKFWGERYDENREAGLIAYYTTGNGLFGYQPLSIVNLSGVTGFSPSILTSSNELTFEPTIINQYSLNELIITNNGNTALHINDIQFNSSNFYSNQNSLTISPDSSQNIVIFFQPSDAIYYSESMQIFFNNPLTSPNVISLNGMGLPGLQSQLELSPLFLQFEPTIVGDSLISEFVISNEGNTTLSVNSIISLSPDFQMGFSPVSINPGYMIVIPVIFRPLSNGLITGTIEIFSENAGNGTNHYINVRGVGYDGFFQSVNPTGLPYHVVIDSISTFSTFQLNIGDEIGIYDEDQCVGSGVISNEIFSGNSGSLVLDGDGDYIDCGIPSLIFDSITGTMEAWVKPSQLFSDHWFFSYSMDNEHAFAACILSNGALGYQMNSGGVHGSSSQTADLNEWTHVAITWNNMEIKLFVDGLLDQVINQSGYPTSSEAHLLIGTDSFIRSQYSFYGSLDEVRLWNVERSENQIISNMNNTISSNAEGLIGYWQMDNVENSNINDLTGHGYNGSMIGDIFVSMDNSPVITLGDVFTQLQITTWEKDDSYGLPGFTNGDSMLFLVRSYLNNDGNDMLRTYLSEPTYINGDGFFGSGQLSTVKLFVTSEEYSKNIEFSTMAVDFGGVQIDSFETNILTIYNTGNFLLDVSKISVSDSTFSLSGNSFSISPGDSATLEIVFQPNGIQSFEDTLVIENNDLDIDDQLTYIYLTALGIDTIGPRAPVNLIATPASKSISLTWINSPDTDVDKYLIYRSFSSNPDSIIAELSFPNTTYTDTSALYNLEYYYYIFPTDTLDNLGIPSDTVSAIPYLRHIVVSDSTLDFGGIQVDSVGILNFTIWNGGNQPLSISEINHYYSVFTLSDTMASLFPADSIEIFVTFQPESPTEIVDTVAIVNDDVDLADQLKIIQLFAAGIDTIAPSAPTNISSQTAPRVITIDWAKNSESDVEKYLVHKGINAPQDSIVAEIISPDTIYYDTDVMRDIEYYYYISAVDAVGNVSTPSDTIMAIAINSPPEINIISDISQELHGNISFKFTVEDAENDDLLYQYLYTTDGQIWHDASVSIISDSNNFDIIDTLDFIWNSEQDLGNNQIINVFLKLEAFDSFDTSLFVTNPLNIDNYVGRLSIGNMAGVDEFSGDVQFPYEIHDTTFDHYSISVTYSIDSGTSWDVSSISENLTDIDSTNYLDTLHWVSLQNLLNFDGEVLVAFSLNDGWQFGTGDTLSLSLDNQFLPTLTGVELAQHWYEPIKFNFNKELDYGSVLGGLLVNFQHGTSDNLEIDFDIFSKSLTVFSTEGWVAGDTLGIWLTTGIVDLYGNPFDGNGNDDPDTTGDSIYFSIPIGFLGDYNESNIVDFDDLITFQQIWFSDTLNVNNEIGPATGIPPFLQISPDNKFNFEDLMVFVQMWNWSAGFNFDGSSLNKSDNITNNDLKLETSYPSMENRNDIFYIHVIIPEFLDVGAIEFSVQYDTTDILFNNLNSHVDNSWVILKKNDINEGLFIINMADLNKKQQMDSHKPFTIEFTRKESKDTQITWRADIRDRNGKVKFVTSQKSAFKTTAPIPGTYALHQNYPNPFNPSTTIRYDLPEDTYVQLIIYNLLGQEVIELVNKKQIGGFHHISWNSKNQTGKIVSPGIYFYLLKTDQFIAAKKLVLLK